MSLVKIVWCVISDVWSPVAHPEGGHDLGPRQEFIGPRFWQEFKLKKKNSIPINKYFFEKLRPALFFYNIGLTAAWETQLFTWLIVLYGSWITGCTYCLYLLWNSRRNQKESFLNILYTISDFFEYLKPLVVFPNDCPFWSFYGWVSSFITSPCM